MKRIFKSRISKIFVILFILGIGLLIFMIWGLHDTNQKMGLKVSIPEIDAEKIVKSLYYENDSLVEETVSIVSNNTFSDYTIIKIKNSEQNINKFLSNRDFKEYASSPLNVFGIDVWNYHEKADIIDFKYRYTTPPIAEKELADTVLIQRFDKKDEKIEISLTTENKKDMEIKIKQNLPPTIVLYKRKTNLYLMVVYRIYDKENKWVTQEELEKNLYPLVKNWGVYEKS